MSTTLKAILSLVLVLVMFALWRFRNQWAPRLPSRWRRFYPIVYLVSRLAIFALAFLVVRTPMTTDIVNAFTMSQAIHSGLVPFRDVEAFGYSPLFFYIVALASTELQIVLLMLGADVLTTYVFFHLLSRDLDEAQLKVWGALWLVAPLPIWASIINAQEEMWILLAFSLALSTFLSGRLRGRSVLGGALLTLGFLATKIVALLPLPFVLAFAPHPRRAVIGSLAMLCLSLPLFVTFGADSVILPLDQASGMINSRPTLWYLLHSASGGRIPHSSPLYPALLFLVLLAINGWLLFRVCPQSTRSPIRQFVCSWVLFWSVFGLLSPHGNQYYTVIWLPALLALWCFLPPRPLFTVAVCVICLVSNAHEWVWVIAGRPTGDFNLFSPPYLLLGIQDTLTLVAYAAGAFIALRGLLPERNRVHPQDSTVLLTEARSGVNYR